MKRSASQKRISRIAFRVFLATAAPSEERKKLAEEYIKIVFPKGVGPSGAMYERDEENRPRKLRVDDETLLRGDVNATTEDLNELREGILGFNIKGKTPEEVDAILRADLQDRKDSPANVPQNLAGALKRDKGGVLLTLQKIKERHESPVSESREDRPRTVMVDPVFFENLVKEYKTLFETADYIKALELLASNDEKRKEISSRIYKDIYKPSSHLAKAISKYTEGDKKDYLLNSIRSLSKKAADNLTQDFKSIAEARKKFKDILQEIANQYKEKDLFNRNTDVNGVIRLLVGNSEQSRGVRMNFSLELRNPKSRAYKICKEQNISDPSSYFIKEFGKDKEIVYSDEKLKEELESAGMDPSMKPAVILSTSRRRHASSEFWMSFSL